MKRKITQEIKGVQKTTNPSESTITLQGARAEWSAPTYKEIDCSRTWNNPGAAGDAGGRS